MNGPYARKSGFAPRALKLKHRSLLIVHCSFEYHGSYGAGFHQPSGK